MPTGYTADIGDGKPVTFQEFAIKCARAMGALIMMRDEPMDAPIPEFKPGDWHVKELEKANAALAEFKSLSNDELRQMQKREYGDYVDWTLAYRKKNREENARYDAMLEHVYRWSPPTEDHEGFKRFMVDQLTISKNREDRDPIAEMQPFKEWRADKLRRLERDVEYHTAHNAEEIKRTNERNEWVRQLKESLCPPPQTKE